MRALKFRLWHTEEYPVEGMRNTMTNYPDLSLDGAIDAHNYGDGVLMQSTGLCDWLGQELFDGDIVEFESKSMIDHLKGEPMKTRRRVITWNQEKMCWWVGSEDTGFKPDMQTDEGHFTLLGNIYQNPELIPDTEKVFIVKEEEHLLHPPIAKQPEQPHPLTGTYQFP